jgi:hypothetical protein
LSRLVGSIKKYGRQSMHRLLTRYADSGATLCGAGRRRQPDRSRLHRQRSHPHPGARGAVVQDHRARGSREAWSRVLHLAGARFVPGNGQAAAPAGRTTATGVDGAWPCEPAPGAEQKCAALAAWLVLDGRKL